LHYVGDTFSSIIVLTNGVVSTIFEDSAWVSYVDPICGCCIVIIILLISLPLIRTVSAILLQKSPADVDVIKIQERILIDIEDVLEIHDFHIWQLVDSVTVCSMHIVIYEKEINKFNDINHKIHKILHKDGVQSATIQPEFIKEDELEYATVNEYGKLVPLNLSHGCKNSCDDENCCSTSRNSLSKKRDSLQKTPRGTPRGGSEEKNNVNETKEVEIELSSLENF
jgi:hypothetical protein